MVSWKLATLFLCSYGFFKEFKPSEPFLTPYLNSTVKNFTLEELSSEIFPIWTYSYLIALLIVFFIADMFRYKPLVIVEGAAYAGTRALLIWGSSIFAMQCMQICYGIASATEVAYFSYVYSIVEPSKYQKVTGYTRSVVLFGRSMAGLLGQLLISTDIANYLILNYVSAASVSIAVIISWFLPSVKLTVFEIEGNINVTDDTEPPPLTTKCCNSVRNFSFRQLWTLFVTSYSNRKILMWSLWWALTMCGYLQAGNYVQNLWSEIASESNADTNWNGAVEAMATLLGSAVAFSISIFTFGSNNTTFQEILLGFVAGIDFLLLVVMGKTNTLWLAYLCHILYRSAYALMISLASLHIASQLKTLGFGLVFGWNTFLALIFQTVLTVIVADENGLNLPVRMQFVVYGCYHGFIAIIFLLRPIWNCIRAVKKKLTKTSLLVNEETDVCHGYTHPI